MRTLKILGVAVAFAAVAGAAQAQQTDLQPGAFPAIDRMARMQALRVLRMQQMQQMRQFRMHRTGPVAMVRGSGVRAGAGDGFRRAGARAGFRAGAHAGFRKGRAHAMRARIASATPEQRALFEQWRAQRQAVRQQVLDGTLTREQARKQMQQWRAEHLPKK